MYHAFSHLGLTRGNDCWLTIGGECMRLRQAGQLTEGSPHFREQAEAWLADVLGEDAAALMVDRPRGVNFGLRQNESWVRGYAHPRSVTAQKNLTLQQFSDRVAHLSPLVMITRKP